MNCDTAILAVSFGTTHMDALKRSIEATERAVAEQFPDCPVYRAFLSATVIRRLKERYALQTDSVGEALTRIEADGHKQVVIQPTLLLPGGEYGHLAKEAEKTGLRTVIGRPLLERDADCEALASIVMEENPLREGEALVLAGHGTDHEAGSVCFRMQKFFEEKKYPAFLSVINGKPSFQDAVEKLLFRGARRAKLLPLMFVAGSHAKNDMAGEEGSLLSLVREAGIFPDPVFRGLGESPGMQALYVERVREAMKELYLPGLQE